MLKIRVFRAMDFPEECMRYINGHRKVLEAYGVTKVTSANVDWMYEPHSYISTVETEDEKVLAGCRVQVAGGDLPLPIESAINTLDTRIFGMIEHLRENGGTAELCGLWNSREIAGWGIGSIVMGQVGVALVTQLPITTMVAFCAQATFKNCQRLGFTIKTELGNNGTFYYPKEDLIATALIIQDPDTLSSAHPEVRDRIMDLRHEPIQRTHEKGPKGEMDLDYNIRIQHTALAVPNNA
ncbi:hypothetical protein KTO58_20775 [Chitinophaga pendula]|uniref:hypothetical protein n=1 Tax=Chitinophaga TaxID=79328 RepID=UPI000BB0B892|nr:MULTISPECIES: hypothetical protein [Chitinophaga]ASZ10926.1 hypothetical protein CK934_08030 [Chitinophaga sp. MD30]UCJ06086.1 hypothetical protein KTO58_20775 [Chitinophaga pendula]